MTAKFIKYYPVFILLFIVSIGILLYRYTGKSASNNNQITTNNWQVPNLDTAAPVEKANQLRYGKDLIANTAKYFGPKGSISSVSNGMNCQNCHLDAGTRLYGNCFATVASSYPKYRDRSGRIESIEFRINDCIERSLNGTPIDTLSKEMQAMAAYIRWLGNSVPRGTIPPGCGIQEIAFLQRACDTSKGKIYFMMKCQTCHTASGQGVLKADSTGYIYPPLWGPHSYNTGAGIYRVSRLASFIQKNMPYSNTSAVPQLSEEAAWDLAGFISSQQRPEKIFSGDWKKSNTKPIDYPYGPFADSFTAIQHKYGPFIEMQKLRVHQKN